LRSLTFPVEPLEKFRPITEYGLRVQPETKITPIQEILSESKLREIIGYSQVQKVTPVQEVSPVTKTTQIQEIIGAMREVPEVPEVPTVGVTPGMPAEPIWPSYVPPISPVSFPSLGLPKKGKRKVKRPRYIRAWMVTNPFRDIAGQWWAKQPPKAEIMTASRAYEQEKISSKISSMLGLGSGQGFKTAIARTKNISLRGKL
jgi:hypothetical protein